jgi:SAM-dependent methyltransferase
MPFKQFVRAEIAAGLDETYRFEQWSVEASGDAYYAVHLAVIDQFETCVPTLQRLLAGSGRRILESGCGTGRWMAFFERMGHHAFGVDDSSGALQVAHHHRPRMRLARGDVVASPYRDASFDVVFSSYVAEHFEDGPLALLREIHRVLKPNGLLLLIVPYNNWFRRCVTNRMLQAFYRVARARQQPLAFTEFRYSEPEVRGFVEAAGFRFEHSEPDDFRFPLAKGLSLDLGRFVLPHPGTWELNRGGRILARVLNGISPWLSCAGILCVARKEGFEGPTDQGFKGPTRTLEPSNPS